MPFLGENLWLQNNLVNNELFLPFLSFASSFHLTRSKNCYFLIGIFICNLILPAPPLPIIIIPSTLFNLINWFKFIFSWPNWENAVVEGRGKKSFFILIFHKNFSTFFLIEKLYKYYAKNKFWFLFKREVRFFFNA